MRRYCSHLFPLISMLLLSSALSYGQAWNGILAPSRAIDWTNAGLPSTITYGTGGSACNGSTANCVETTTNPWTPPTRVQSGSTITCANNSTDASTINTALSAAGPGSYVLLGSTTCDITSNINLVSGVTLRGSGPQSTILNVNGTTQIYWGGCCTGINSGSMSATSYSSGATSVTITGTTCTTNCASGGNLVAGNTAYFEQCDTGWTGSGTNYSTDPSCTSGSYSDPGTIWVCGINYGVCAKDNNNTDTNHFYSRQLVTITNVVNNGGGSYTVTFTPGLYLSNWSSNNNAMLFWTPYGTVPTYKTIGTAIEDLTVNLPFNQNDSLSMANALAPWIKGLRVTGGVVADNISIANASHWLFSNNYIFGLTYNNLSSANTEPFLRAQDADGLALNNIFQSGQCFWANGKTTGDVIAYNYCRDGATGYYQNLELDHNPFEAFRLVEGNQMGHGQDDDTHGTHDLNTWFRNYFSGWDPPYTTLNSQAFSLDGYHRMDNFIGNALGGAKSTAYQGTSFGDVYLISTTDALAGASFMRWGNCDVINAGCRFLAAEVPNSTNMSSTSYPNAVAYQNPTPSNDNLPCSFFMSGSAFTTSPCSIKTSGGTGLSWWKVCTSWTTFPTSCSGTQAQPFPPAGPDQTSGPYVDGYAYDTPAAVAYTYLPIDTSQQNSLTITGSSWSGGTETLTVSFASIDNGSANHIMGGFQMSGVNSKCIPGGINFSNLYGSNEILMTGSSTASVQYALTSNPGVSCTGTLLWPDVRQFDERVYEDDPGGDPPAPPTGLQAVVN